MLYNNFFTAQPRCGCSLSLTHIFLSFSLVGQDDNLPYVRADTKITRLKGFSPWAPIETFWLGPGKNEEHFRIFEIYEFFEIFEILDTLEILKILEILEILEILDVLEILEILRILEILEILQILEILEIFEYF